MPKTPEALDESKQNRLRKDVDLSDAGKTKDLEDVLNTTAGRRVMFRVLELAGCGVLTSSVEVLGSHITDTHATFEQLGRRNLGEQLKLDWLHTAPRLFRKMMDEETNRIGEGILLDRATKTKSAKKQEEEDVPE